MRLAEILKSQTDLSDFLLSITKKYSLTTGDRLIILATEVMSQSAEVQRQEARDAASQNRQT